ncbi:MAG TPA: alpha/beta fold hydrolase [Caulobacteraceae bacterium]
MADRLGLFVVGWLLILSGGLMAHSVQTAGGTRVLDVRYPGQARTVLSALLYVPRSATPRRPAPAVMVSHGYINTREMQSPFAIELARRGFVVLAIDMTGHGYSGGSAGADDGGGPEGLRFLQSLAFVDKTEIGLEGHSMGGLPIVGAALSQPGGYRSMVLEGSTTPEPGQLGAGTPSFPRNLALVFGRYDEFAPLMWHEARGSDVGRAPKLETLFGSARPVVPDRLYGSLAGGTARLLVNPGITHPAEHFSTAGVAAAVDWFQRTLRGEASPRAPGDQIWPWKEVGTGVALAGFVVLLLGAFRLLLATPLFAGLAEPGVATTERRGPRWWVAFILTAAIPALTFYPFMTLGLAFPPSRFFPQWVTNQVLVWALLNGAISLGLGFIPGAPKAAFALRPAKSLLIAAATVGVGCLALALCDRLFKVDFRFWVVGLKPLDGRHFAIFIAYVAPFTLAFAAMLRAANVNLAVRGEKPALACVWAICAMALGFVILLAAQYATLFWSGRLITPKEALSTIIAIQFVPILVFVGLIGSYAFRRTNSYAPGAAICGLVVTWYIVAGTATHWSEGWRPPKTAGLYPDRPASMATVSGVHRLGRFAH